MNVEILEQCEATTKKNAKVKLLTGADKQLRHFIKLALDQNVTFGVTVDEDEQINHWGQTSVKPNKDFWVSMERMLERFAKREQTGNEALSSMAHVLSGAPDEMSLKWACRIINRNLRAGFDVSTANKAWGEDSVKKFKVQLAESLEDLDIDEGFEGTYFLQPKLDGNRVVMIDEKPMSRGGKVYPNCEFAIDEIKDKLGPGFFDDWVVDGEMMGNLGFDQSSGALRRSSGKGKKADFTYWVFDLVDRRQWERQSTEVLIERQKWLEKLFKGMKRVKIVPTKVVVNPTIKEIMDYCQECVDNGFEGAMLKNAHSPYKWKRADNVIKVKLFKDADCRVVGFYEGKGQHKGSLGGIYVEAADGTKSKCGSGFSHKFDPNKPDKVLRQDVWKNQKDWLGAVVQVKYFEKTKDGSFRLPVFVMRRRDKE